jgi:small-conductance mechanosensitive channel
MAERSEVVNIDDQIFSLESALRNSRIRLYEIPIYVSNAYAYKHDIYIPPLKLPDGMCDRQELLLKIDCQKETIALAKKNIELAVKSKRALMSQLNEYETNMVLNPKFRDDSLHKMKNEMDQKTQTIFSSMEILRDSNIKLYQLYELKSVDVRVFYEHVTPLLEEIMDLYEKKAIMISS